MKVCLIVDDSDIIRKYARLIFESLGFRAVEADSPKQAMERLTAEPPHLILADWRMPGAQTSEMIIQMRRASLSHRPFILFMATENDAAEFERAKFAGADDVLLKPFNREIIEMKLLDIRLAA